MKRFGILECKHVKIKKWQTRNLMCREEKPARCHWVVYWTYNILEMFRELLCPSSGAGDYMCVITAYGVRCLVCWLSGVRCRAAGYAFGMRDIAAAEVPETFREYYKCNKPLSGI